MPLFLKFDQFSIFCVYLISLLLCFEMYFFFSFKIYISMHRECEFLWIPKHHPRLTSACVLVCVCIHHLYLGRLFTYKSFLLCYYCLSDRHVKQCWKLAYSLSRKHIFQKKMFFASFLGLHEDTSE